MISRTIEANRSFKQRIISGALWLGGLTLIGQLITWAITIIVIRILKPEDYGLLAMANYFLGFLTVFYEVGLGAAIVQKLNIDEQEIKKTLGFVVIVNSSLFCFIFITAPLVARFFSEPHLVTIVRVLGINFVLMSFYIISQSMLIRELKFRKKALIEWSSNLFSSGIVLIMALLGFGVWALVSGMIGMQLFRVIAYNSQRSLRYRPVFSMKGVKDLLTFGGYVTVARFLWFCYSQADILIVGRILGKDLLGIYSVAMHLVSLPLEKVTPLITQIGFPAFSHLQEDLHAVGINFVKLIRVLNIFSFPLFVGIAFIASDAIPLLLGSKWAEVTLPLQILSITMPLRFIGVAIPPAVNGIGRPEVITGNMLFAVIIMPCAFLIGTQWGIIGLCYAWLTAYPILFSIMTWRALRVLRISIKALLGSALVPFLASGVMVLGLFVFKLKLGSVLPNIWYLMVLVITGAVLYTSTVLFIDRNAFREIRNYFSRD
jgi:O-antigen/teichoic acid export membrane protein